jgi:hypothetical protein
MAPSQKIAPISSSASSTMLPQAVIEARSAGLPKGAIIGLIFMGVILVAVFLYLCLRYSRQSKWLQVLSSLGGAYQSALGEFDSAIPSYVSPQEVWVPSPREAAILASHVSPQEVWAPSPREVEILASREPPPVDSSTIPCTIEGCIRRFATPSDLKYVSLDSLGCIFS